MSAPEAQRSTLYLLLQTIRVTEPEASEWERNILGAMTAARTRPLMSTARAIVRGVLIGLAEDRAAAAKERWKK